jgi:hypothetical protein
MNAKAGKYLPDDLASELNRLAAQVRTTRREQLGGLIVDLDRLAYTISSELQIDEAILEQEKTRFKQQFSFFDRINPFNTERREAQQRDVTPIQEEVKQDRVLLTRCCELLEWVRNASQPIEWRTNWHGGIAGVYNEHTGQTEWRESWHTGIAGVYHPDRQKIEWCEEWKHGVAGVFNPVTRKIEWRTNWHGGVAGVFHPIKQMVEWRESWHHGVSGVFNPLTGKIEWMETWKAGVAGAWSPTAQSVQWRQFWRHGVACIYFDGTTYRSTGSYYGDEDDD